MVCSRAMAEARQRHRLVDKQTFQSLAMTCSGIGLGLSPRLGVACLLSLVAKLTRDRCSSSFLSSLLMLKKSA